MSHRPEKRAYVTDAAHMPSLLEPNPLLPPMLIRFTEYLGGIIAGASHSPSTEWKESKVRCRRRPGHRPCPGPINVRTGCEDPPEILWECPSCGEHGVIRNWQGCEWDNSEDRWNLREAEGAYAESLFRDATGDSQGSLAALERSLSFKSDYAPAVLSMGSVEYKRGRREEGRRLLLSLGGLADKAADLPDIIDEAGMFLIQEKEYEDGIALYRAAVERIPDSPALYAGCACCAGHMGRFDEALEAAERAVDLDPANPSFVNDLGWTLLLAGRLDEACEVLERAMDMNPADELARENLNRCQERMAKRSNSEKTRKRRRPVRPPSD